MLLLFQFPSIADMDPILVFPVTLFKGFAGLHSLCRSFLSQIVSPNMSRLVIIALCLYILSVAVDGASRQPNNRDHLHCKMEYISEWEEVMQTADPYAIVESYYVSGVVFASKRFKGVKFGTARLLVTILYRNSACVNGNHLDAGCVCLFSRQTVKILISQNLLFVK